ncbi:hypothetical protein DRN86_00405 [Candidatus Geothermarchaeota archaeon]|nr:MAG: hypothetical protein DRN86_00405 [Candidatus Geothermarchaeota archaeon]
MSRDHSHSFKIDLHVHTYYSQDACISPKIAVKYALKKGLSGLAITDHNNTRGAQLAIKYSSRKILIIPGVEIKTKYGHLLLLNIADKDMGKRVCLTDLLDKVHENNGIVVLAHPYHSFSGLAGFNKILRYVDAIEVLNSNIPFLRRGFKKALKLALDNSLGMTAGSDSHIPQTIGLAYLSFKEGAKSADDIIKLIKNRRGVPYGREIEFSLRIRKIAETIRRII